VGGHDVPSLVRAAREAVLHVDGGALEATGFCVVEARTGKPCVITNAHVVGGTERLCARLYDDREVEAHVRFAEPTLDVAVLDLAEEPIGTLPLRAIRDVRLGEPVVAIGSAYGMEGTVSAGIISGIDRSEEFMGSRIENLLLTDALIGEGNSGGPLLGADGRVLGVNTLLLEDPHGDPSGFGYAIPASAVEIALLDHHRHGAVRRGTLGLHTEMRELTASEQRRWGVLSGLVVTASPCSGTPGQRAGVRRGDLIVALDGRPVSHAGDIFALLDHSRIEKHCEIDVIRMGERISLGIEPAPRA
jgi:S1-C subfamily serine protease